MDRPALLAHLRNVGAAPGAQVDIADTALVLAALDRPDADIATYRRYLAALAEETVKQAPARMPLPDRAAILAQVIYRDHGFSGDTETYEDVQNANLIRVIDRRKGLPVALGILCMHAARACGWEIEGLNFPSHFLIQLSQAGDRLIVDPFNGARPMDAPALRQRLKEVMGSGAELKADDCAAVHDRDILLRLQNNIKVRALQKDDFARAAGVVESMMALAPVSPGLMQEFAVLQARQGNMKRAIETAEALLAWNLPAGEHGAVQELLRRLKGSLH